MNTWNVKGVYFDLNKSDKIKCYDSHNLIVNNNYSMHKTCEAIWRN